MYRGDWRREKERKVRGETQRREKERKVNTGSGEDWEEGEREEGLYM